MSKKDNIPNFVLTRSIVFYLACIFLSLPLINYQRIKIADRSKVNFYTEPQAYHELVQYIEEGKPIAQEKLEEYIYFLEKSLEKNPSSLDYAYVLAFLNSVKGDWPAAAKIYQNGLQKQQKNLWFYYNLATIYFDNSQYEDALNILSTAVTIPPENTLSFFNNSPKLLLPIVTEARVTPSDLKRHIKELYRDSYAMMILSYYQTKNFEKMRQWSQMALVANLGHEADFYFYAGLAYYELGDDSEAATNFKKAIARRNDLDEAYQFLALSLKRQKHEEEAQAAFAKAEMLKQITSSQNLTEKKFALRIY